MQEFQPLSNLPPIVYAYGFSWRKHAIIKRFVPASVRFVRRLSAVPKNSHLLVWGSPEQDLSNYNVLQVEDGFIRSVGLGAMLIKPSSLVIDPVGIYYDSSRPSLLEQILETDDFSPDLLGRASRLRQHIIEKKITKYNLNSNQRWIKPNDIQSPVILVVGQVESDASLRCGSPIIRRNIDLLKIVREHNPKAHLLYKPHPDVVAGLREQGINEEEATQYANKVITNIAIDHLYEHIDELHTLTSLSGFEALMRGIKVVCYGQPFYSGWGLTRDIYPIRNRRKKHISLDKLVAATLILYPVYRGDNRRKTNYQVEDIIAEIEEQQNSNHNFLKAWYHLLLGIILKRTIC